MSKQDMGATTKSVQTEHKSKKKVWSASPGLLILAALLILMFLPSLKRLSFNIWLGALATGLCFAFVAIGVYISFRVLDYPDLTIDGSFPLGAAISATMIAAGFNPYISLLVAVFGGAVAGMVTALIATRLRIHSLLASILTAIALISINLRIMGRSNIPLLKHDTIFSHLAGPFRGLMQNWGGEELAKLSKNLLVVILVGALVIVIKMLFDWFMRTELGLALRATGDNPQMLRALGRDTDKMIVLGLAISNGLVGLSGAIFAQYQGFADVNMGLGLIIAGLAAVILGETIFRPRRVVMASTAVIMGMVIYRLAIASALSTSIPLPNGQTFRIEAQDVKLATAILVLAALWFTRSRAGRKGQG